MATPKPTKNQLRRAKKKEEKKSQKAEVSQYQGLDDARAGAHVQQTVEEPKAEASIRDDKAESKDESAPVVEAAVKGETAIGEDKKEAGADAAEHVQTLASIDYDDPAFSQFKDIFNKFGPDLEGDDVAREANAGNQGEVLMAEDGVPEEEQEDGPAKMSKKKRKKLNTLSIAQLKASVSNPEVVEWHDVSSSDPRLLVVIKAQKNIVPVPGHWSLKREYLSSKRGIEKPAFRLPAFISETGITEMRDAVLEKQAEQTLKQKQRERVQPKMGKLDIDYQKLYDAFFRFQTKPSLTRFGDVYYEGKEWEAEFRNFKPGEISESLQEALNMPPGFPPPWLLQQQRMGPPPSYPNLKIPGLNALLPPGASWGFQAGQWGKPPVDEYNRPLYGGDIFGVPGASEAGGEVDGAQRTQGEPIERAIWGELQPPEEDEEEEEEEDEEDEDEDEDVADGLQTPSGLETPSGFVSSVPTDYPAGPLGVESSMAGELDLRKQRRGYETEDSVAGPRSAYTVIPERQAQAQGFFGSDRTYDLKGGRAAATAAAAAAGAPVLGQDDDAGRKRKKPGDVDVALDPDALLSHDGISKDELQRRFEEGRQDEGVGAQWKKQQYDDDLSEMIAQESRKRQKREEERRGGVAEKKKEAKYRF
ncbi:splicing factor subunit 145kd [Grosmannia clavigera kw1407]|uniref:Splicing factor subunit 145kd n=1 Tax=Grosmannia clavigera (strain kw1407 / UAMH 11150) TaxID=655863 RepID=F0XTF2_GROCL|nr:splicing factor subunit 145kd [Grosmannia clavigera kw1407]EFW98483.1 splicing factor subunit 145kd [Grosmannia clavigera kw1407]